MGSTAHVADDAELAEAEGRLDMLSASTGGRGASSTGLHSHSAPVHSLAPPAYRSEEPSPAASGSPYAIRAQSTKSLNERRRGFEEGTRVSFDTASLMSERVDAEISKRYDIDMREIGIGGYGKVFLAKDRMFKDRQVAIKKVIKIDDERDSAFKKEVTIMKRLDHPNICRLFETYEQGRVMYFVIEFCEGGDLFDRFSNHGQLPETVVAPIIKQVTSALKYAHSKGIAHRDLKLENICFCEKSPNSTHVKVIDWGLAGSFEQGRMKSTVGTSTYSAPEVLDPEDEDDGYTCACDLWSLGIVAYIALSGKPPFWGSAKQQLARMKAEYYPLTGVFWDSVSDAAKDLIRHLLKVDVQARLTADQVLHHPWLAQHKVQPDFRLLTQVLTNVEQFSRAPDFFSFCVASVARQLDHRSLSSIRDAFFMLDQNCDGILDMEELCRGYATAFHPDDPGAVSEAEVQEIFSYLDLDGSGRITFTEFCAAGLGEDGYQDEHVLWSAFKTFDIHDDGQISKEELRQVLQRADITQVWTSSVCEEVAEEVVQLFGSGSDSINFDEWLTLMRESSARHNEMSPKRFGNSLTSLLGTSSFQVGREDSAERTENSADNSKNLEVSPEEPEEPAAELLAATVQPARGSNECCAGGLQRIYRSLSGRLR
ncbi:CPK3 [Symbiodinium natans]|uniref:non-specific serine/threonine protein kinase n=1 Tax=Symbiodinium natans TaxID=878477 RepID=A0A812KUG6_9DINO|nr:CPK3 [Symbiodinium natans]